MRYLFRGLTRESGRAVEGHVEADTPEAACDLLSDNGIVTESIRPDPKSLDLRPTPEPPEFRDAIDSALDSSSTQVSFDELTEQYRGKKVWVIDRDKIRSRVAQVVDSALAISLEQAETALKTRERVALALHGMFQDNRNLASERNADSVAGMRVTGAAPAVAPPPVAPPPPPPRPVPAPPPATPQPNIELEQQILRLGNLVRTAEGVLASISTAARRGFSGGGGGGGGGGYARPRRSVGSFLAAEQNDVLMEIFKTNLKLQRGVDLVDPDNGAAAPAEAAGGDGATATATADDTATADSAGPIGDTTDHGAAGNGAVGNGAADDDRDPPPPAEPV